jgi:hypothetical protein
MEGFIANSKQNDVSNKIVGIDEVERLIDDYENKNSSIPMKDKLDYLRSANEIAKVRIISFSLHNESRINAIIREYKSYSQLNPQNYKRFTFCIEYSDFHPLLQKEEVKLRNFLSEICPNGATTIIYTATNSSWNEKVLVTIIASN